MFIFFNIGISQRITDTIFVAIKDTIRVNDTLFQIVPKTQKYYAKDSLYKAWVSGYKPNLDSIQVYPKTITNTITNTIYKKPTRIGFGIIGGYGINIGAEVKASPFIGAGIFYRIW